MKQVQLFGTAIIVATTHNIAKEKETFGGCLSQTQARDQKRGQVTFQLNFPGDREEPGNKVIQRNKSEIISCRRRNLKDAEC